jgi:hypothetical protein
MVPLWMVLLDDDYWTHDNSTDAQRTQLRPAQDKCLTSQDPEETKQPQSVLYRTGDENTPIADTSVQLCKLHFGRCPITMNTDHLPDF